jgi:hypothetical protein
MYCFLYCSAPSFGADRRGVFDPLMHGFDFTGGEIQAIYLRNTTTNWQPYSTRTVIREPS